MKRAPADFLDLAVYVIWKLLLEVPAIESGDCNPLDTLIEQVLKVAGGSNMNNRHHILVQRFANEVRETALQQENSWWSELQIFVTAWMEGQTICKHQWVNGVSRYTFCS